MTVRVTAYGCGRDEADAFEGLAPLLGVLPTITPMPVSEATANRAAGARCISVGHKTSVNSATLSALRRHGVEYISTRSIGSNHIDTGYAAAIGLTVETVSYSPDSVADYTVMMMLMAARHAASTVRKSSAHDYTSSSVRGRELRDLTVGVIGTGRIGAAVIDRLHGFRCCVLACGRQPKPIAEYVPLDDLVTRSDVVTLHTPLDANTHHLLDRRRIERMKRGAFVINTGRGALIDTVALLDALQSGHLGGAALDVLEGEEGIFYEDHRPGHPDNDLLMRLHALPNVFLSPHVAYDTDHALADMVRNSMNNCIAFEKGRCMPWGS